MKNYRLSLLILFSALLITGCGYHLGVKPVGGIKSVFVAPIKNDTGHAFINESEAASLVLREFQKDGAIRTASEDLADATLYITLTEYNQRAEVFDSQDVGRRFRMAIRAKAVLNRNPSQEEIYQGTFEGLTEYATDLDQFQIERQASTRAISDLGVKIVRAVMEGDW